MTRFSKITVNHSENLLAAGKDVLLNWCYDVTWQRNLRQTAFRIDLFRDGMVYSSGKVEGDAMQFDLGKAFALQELTDYTFTVTGYFSDGQVLTSPSQRLCTGIFGREAFQSTGCHWVTVACAQKKAPAAPEFFRSFRIPAKKKILSARAYLFAAGFSLFLVNGKAPDDRLLAPANSVYEKRCYYETYDLLPVLQSGVNTLSLTCGSGYDQAYSQWGFRYFGKKGFLGLVRIVLEDGETLLIPSDHRWRCRESKITACSMYDGESFDQSKTDFAKIPVTTADAKAPYGAEGLLLPRIMPPIRVLEKTEPVRMWKLGEDLVFDFGENSSAVAELTMRAEKGRKITLFHTEMVFEDGRPDPFTNRKAQATDTYICGSDEPETYMPRFTYHCFRYLQVSGVKENEILSLKKCLLGCDCARTGSFSSSDDTLNRIHGLMICGIRNNLFTIPTDCAVRDERTPCDMDSQAIERSVMENFDTAAYYTKWLEDVVDRYKPGTGNPDWKGDMVSLMWRLYDFYGDIRPAQRHYETALGFFRDLLSRSEDGLMTKGYGDWCHPNEDRWESYFGSVTMVNTALLYGMGQKLHALGLVLGREKAVLDSLQADCEGIRRAFESRCVNPDGSLMGGEQTEMAMPLYEGLAQGEIGRRAAKALVEKLQNEGTLSMGIYGAMSLFRVLQREEQQELALSLLQNPMGPGYAQLLAMGATSLWEQWRYKGGMHSHSHGMFAGADVSFYEMFAGITADAAGYEHICIRPMLPQNMNMAGASLNTVRGRITVSTEKLCQGYEMKLTLPVGVKAKVTLPEIPEGYTLLDGELPMEAAQTLELGSGCYDFRVMLTELQPKR